MPENLLARFREVEILKFGVHTLENVKTYATELIDVWVVDLGEETNFGRSHWVVVWKEELELEDTTCNKASVGQAVIRLFAQHSPSYGDCDGP